MVACYCYESKPHNDVLGKRKKTTLNLTGYEPMKQMSNTTVKCVPILDLEMKLSKCYCHAMYNTYGMSMHKAVIRTTNSELELNNSTCDHIYHWQRWAVFSFNKYVTKSVSVDATWYYEVYSVFPFGNTESSFCLGLNELCFYPHVSVYVVFPFP